MINILNADNDNQGTRTPYQPDKKNEFCRKSPDFFQFSKITRRLLERQLEDIISSRDAALKPQLEMLELRSFKFSVRSLQIICSS